MAVNPRMKLAPERRRIVQSLRKLLNSASRSDQKLYARNKPFLPIFPTDNDALTGAVVLVAVQLGNLINPPIP